MELKISHVSKKYGSFLALDDFNSVLTNGVYALLGPNGAGKSTLMNIIAGVLPPTSGNIFYNGNDITILGKEYFRVFGFLPQTSGFYKNFTAREFLDYMAVLKGMDNKKMRREKIEEMLVMVNLSEAAGKRIGGFSGGMRQRVGIAQALLNDPEILILDEPTAGLDPQERIRFKNLIAKIAFDKIVILATHIVSDVESIAKEMILLKSGKQIMHDSVAGCINQARGHVFNLQTTEDKVPELMNKYKVYGITNQNGRVILRIIAEEAPENAVITEPDLEALYLYHFGEV